MLLHLEFLLSNLFLNGGDEWGRSLRRAEAVSDYGSRPEGVADFTSRPYPVRPTEKDASQLHVVGEDGTMEARCLRSLHLFHEQFGWEGR